MTGIIKKGLQGEIPDSSGLKKIMKEQGESEDRSIPSEEKVRRVIKGLPFGK